MNKKNIVVAVLVVLAVYWLFDHAAPLPLSHEQFGLYQHNIHRLMGVIFLVIAALVWWKWQPKKS